MKTVLFFVIISSLLMSCSHYTKLENQYLELIDDLSDKEKATEAFKKISKFGKEIIPYLLDNSKKEEIFVSKIFIIPQAPVLYEGTTVGDVSLYLIESILNKEEKPYRLPIIVNRKEKWPYTQGGELPKTLEENREKAIEYYKQWWKKVKDLDIEEIRKTSPLKNTDIMWAGKYKKNVK